MVGSLEIRSRGQPDHQEIGRHRGSYGGLQERQRTHVTQQAAMVRPMVRFFLGCQREGLAQHRQTHQQQDARHTDAMVARAYVPRLTEIRVGRTPIGANVSILARTGFPLALKQDFLAVPVDRPRTGQFPVCRRYVRWPMTGPNIASFTERRFTGVIRA